MLVDHHFWSIITRFISPYLTLFMTIYDHLWPFLTVYFTIYNTIYDHFWPFMTMYDHLWPFTTIYFNIHYINSNPFLWIRNEACTWISDKGSAFDNWTNAGTEKPSSDFTLVSMIYTANHKKGYSCSKRYFSWKKWLFNIFFVRIWKSIIKWSECHKSHEFSSIILDFMIKRR